MTQKDKELLIKDLCARLPYEIILLSPNEKTTYQTDGNTAAELLVEEGWKPYLRPMSSITKEEREQMRDLWVDADIKTHAIRLIDFYNKQHLDYRGLIQKGLAIEVTEENNPYK